MLVYVSGVFYWLSVFYSMNAAFALGSSAEPRPWQDGGPAISATALCKERVGPGRILCTVEVNSSQTLQWVDLVIEAAPPHLALLERRFSDKEATRRTETTAKFDVALIAKSHGSGQVPFLVRGVLCGKNAACRPETIRIQAEARVVE